MSCGTDHDARTGRVRRARCLVGRRRGVPRPRMRSGSRDARADRTCACPGAQVQLEHLPAARQLGGAGRPVVRRERGSAGDDHRRTGKCRGRERHRRPPRRSPPVALPRVIEAPIHQRCDVESCLRVATRLCSAIPGFRLGRLAPRFEDHPEVERGTGVPGGGCLPIRGRRRIQIAALLEQQAQLESFLRALVTRGRTVVITDHGSGQLGFSQR
jgi:hypothetical protein